jgi:hypothetical protein
MRRSNECPKFVSDYSDEKARQTQAIKFAGFIRECVTAVSMVHDGQRD